MYIRYKREFKEAIYIDFIFPPVAFPNSTWDVVQYISYFLFKLNAF